MEKNNHFCKTGKCWGKAYHILLGSSGIYCAYCNCQLEKDQVAKRYDYVFKNGERK